MKKILAKTAKPKERDVSFTVPLVAPSVNHYKGRAKNGHWFVFAEATAFKDAVCILCRGQQVAGKAYQVDLSIFLGEGQKGDVDNFTKVCLDALVEARVIESDAWIQALCLKKGRDAENPRTEFRIRSL